MERKAIFTTIITIFILLPNSIYGQYISGQKILELSANTKYAHANTTGATRIISTGSYIEKQQTHSSQIGFSAILYKAISEKFLIGHGISLNYGNNFSKGSNVDSLETPYNHWEGSSNSFSGGYSLNYKWLFPITPKFGGNIYVNTAFTFGYGKGNYTLVTDTNNVMKFNNNTNFSGQIIAGLTLGIYYWVSPRIILQTGINIASARIGVTSNLIEFESGSLDNIVYSSNFNILFSNPQSLAAQYIGISFLLK